MTLRRWLLILCSGISGLALGQSPLDSATLAFMSAPAAAGATLAFSLRQTDSDSLLFSSRGDDWMIPASNIKLLTTAAAWRLLGPDHRIPTSIRLEGMVVDSVFLGQVILEGAGDPSLASGRFGLRTTPESIVARWVTGIRSAGIRDIRGRLVCRPESYPGSPVGLTWEWGDLGGCFAQGLWPVNWDENCLKVQLDRNSLGYALASDSLQLPWPVIVYPEPARRPGGPDFLTGGPGPTARWVGGPEEMTLPLAMRVAIPDVPGYLAVRMPALFRGQGMAWTEWDPRSEYRSLVWQDTLWSPPLSVLIRLINQESVNLYAEALLRRLGNVLGRGGSTGSGLDVLRTWLDSLGFSPLPFLHDGSGLSRHNAWTPNALSGFVALCARTPEIGSQWLATLPEGGRSGTLSRYFKDRRLRGRIRAKTGTMNRTRCLTGVLVREDGRSVTFSILANQYTGSVRSFMELAEDWLVIAAGQSD